MGSVTFVVEQMTPRYLRLGDANVWWLEIKQQEPLDDYLAIRLVDLGDEVDCASPGDIRCLVCQVPIPCHPLVAGRGDVDGAGDQTATSLAAIKELLQAGSSPPPYHPLLD